ncbi:MAG TPA: ATP-binding protein [Chryseolinea sp.]|nr:ATP-binding protein [Chryseolinea sp.]
MPEEAREQAANMTMGSLAVNLTMAMNAQLIRVLLIEDDEDDVFLAQEYLRESGYYRFNVEWEANPILAREKMLNKQYDVFLIDYRLGSENGLDLIKFAQDNGVLAPCILLTGQGDLNVDLDASRFGASDYLVKTELSPSLLERSIRYALSQAAVIRELDEKEKKYRSLFERSIDPIFLANEKMEIIDVNTAFLKYFNYSPTEALSLEISSLFAEKVDYHYSSQVLKEAEQIKDFEVALISKNGGRKICLLNCVFIPDQASGFCCYQGIVHDLTIRKKAEKDMLLAERLSMTGKIARTIAHEVRNPLTNLTLALEQLKDEIPVQNDSVKLFSDIIQRNANRIEQLIGEMLNSSKPRELNLELVTIDQVVHESMALAIDRMNLNQIKLEQSLAPDLPRLLVDKDKIKIALLNIIINAIEAMKPGEGVLKIESTRSGDFIILHIADNGKGIKPEEIEKLFDPFYTNKDGGMGLGLTSTKNILNGHSATVEVTSQLDEGTAFAIHFKLSE